MQTYNEDILAVLLEQGLSKTEAIIYLTLLKKGPSTAYKISKEAGLYKANTYQAIEGLIKKNLATHYMHEGKNLIKSFPPEDILKMLDRQKENFQSILPMMERTLDEESDGISVLVGVKSFMNELYTLLSLKKSIYAFDIPSIVPEKVSNFIDNFHRERIKNKVSMYHVYDYDAADRIKYLNKLKYTYAKKGLVNRSSTVSTLVCGDVTLIINWTKEIKTIVIKDKDVADAYKTQFDMLWK
jgi:sugar-specific transcriptional regulator TrmB